MLPDNTNSSNKARTIITTEVIKKTSGYATWLTAAPKPQKIHVF